MKKYGLNKIKDFKPDSKLKIFLAQFQSPLIYILLFASLIFYITGDYKDSLIILFVLIFNATIGTFQESRAQNALLSLRRFIETKATVIRSSQEEIIDSSEVVLGDIILLKEGEKVPADARLIETKNLKIDESSLTGESIPIHKIEKIIE
ncbi:MAG: HAD-IC family P-type ATPase, partial [Patescibacteria group bacterium]|nr:HAD-IC family P-type ATPase [Patescibacteria group bacterium]